MLSDATRVGLTQGSALHPANPGAVTQRPGLAQKQGQIWAADAWYLVKNAAEDVSAFPGHHFFLSQLNASSGEHREGRQSEHEHAGSPALLWLQAPTLWTQGRALGAQAPCRSSFPHHLPPRLLAQLVFPAGPYTQLLTHRALLIPQCPCSRSPAVPWLHLVMSIPPSVLP